MRHGAGSLRRCVATSVAAILLAVLPTEAPAFSSGVSGQTARTGGGACQSCHGNSGTTVVISGAGAVNKGATSTYTVTLTRATAPTQPAGVDIAATDGATLGLVGGMPTQFVGSGATREITHYNVPGPLRSTNGSGTATYQFTFTMPAGAASGAAHILYAAGAVDFGGGAAHASNFTVKARPTAPTSVTPSSITPVSVDLSWSGAGSGPHYRVVYKVGASAPANETDGATVDVGGVSTHTVIGLSASTQYSFAVFSKLNPDAIFSSTAATTTATTTANPAAARHVDAATGVNTGACTSAGSPCKTITYAMAQAAPGAPGDSIQVAPGTYNVALGETFPIVVKSGVQLVSTGSPESTLIDATGANARVLETFSPAHATTTIDGFTVTGGFVQPAADGSVAFGGGIRIDGGSPTIRRNIIVANEVRGYDGTGSTFVSGGEAYGGGIYGSNATPVIVNNVIRGNTARGGQGKSNPGSSTPGSDGGSGQGGGIHVAGPGGGQVQNNTIYGNTASGGNGGFSLGAGGQGGNASYGGVFSDGLAVNNNILALNAANAGTGGSGSPAGGAGFASYGALSYNNAPGNGLNNLFHGNTVDGAPSNGDTIGNNSQCFIGGGCASVHFHSEPANLRITTLSPAVGTGTATGAPLNDMDGVARANPPSIGAFEPADPTNTYNMVLEGWQQVSPYVVTPAVGSGTASYNTVTRQLTLNLPYSGLTGTETMAHIHGPGARGVNAGIQVTLAAGSPKTDIVTLTIAQEAMLLAGELYVNIHTSPSHPNGEIRAQIDNAGATVTRVLTVNKAGTGTGTVTGTAEPGTVVNCGVDCTETVPNGKGVQLSASASAGSTFAGWGGACTGTGACNVTMDAAKSALATFTLIPSALPGAPAIGTAIAGNAQATVSFTAPASDGGSAITSYTVAASPGGMTASGASSPITVGGLTNGTAYTFTVAATNANGTGPASAASNSVTPTDPNPPRLANISTRMQVLTGADVMIGGFVIGGSGTKRVAIVATGPSLTAFGITNPLANPTLRLVRSSDQAVLATNDDWQAAANSAQLTAAGFAPSHNLEAAILVDLAPGAYTAIVEGVGGGTGVAVIGVYEVDGLAIPLINISTRGRVLTGVDVMIGGFVIQGSGSQTVAIVATGPSLAAFGITSPLANPTIRLVRSSDQATLATNDDWQADASAAQLQAAGFAPTDALESGLYRTLPPGAYTVIVEGVGGGTGVAVIGVYKVGS